jgi:hypothetical protein
MLNSDIAPRIVGSQTTFVYVYGQAPAAAESLPARWLTASGRDFRAKLTGCAMSTSSIIIMTLGSFLELR